MLFACATEEKTAEIDGDLLLDADADGFIAAEDCDDSDAGLNPAAEEQVGDGVDQNCDGCDLFYEDADDDGYTSCNNDCDDSDPAVTGEDLDGDGWSVCEGDCDDNDQNRYTNVAEILNDHIDQDCDDDLVAGFSDLDGDRMPDCADDDVDGDGVPGVDDCDDLDVGVGQFGAHECPYPWQQGIQSCADALTFWGVSAGDDDDSAAGSAEGITAASGVYEVKLPNASSAESVYCDMERHGGGWTLALIASDDGQDTWTWADSQLLTNIPAPIGSLSDQPLDFAAATDLKAPAYHALNFSDLLFVHHSIYSGAGGLSTPFETWAAYDGVGDGSETLPVFMLGQVAPSCLPWALSSGPLYVNPEAQATAYPMSAGTLVASGALCFTHLYFHLGGHNTYQGRNCDDVPHTLWPHSYGPSWAAVVGPDTYYSACASGPGWSSLGLGSNHIASANAGVVDVVDESLVELPGLGFGLALGLNVAESGTGINHLRMYIR